MKKRLKKLERKKNKYFTVLLVCIVTGFIVGYSYNVAKDRQQVSSVTSNYYEQTESYRSDLIEQQERNRELEQELADLQNKIRQYERDYNDANDFYDDMYNEAQQLRLALGEVASVGEGIAVTLSDGSSEHSDNPNDYIVHESHIFNVIQELKIAGAEAISINGQRLKPNSYISCNGPVITVDGNQYPAPFVIEAIGNQNTLLSSLELDGGVVEQLLADHIVVSMEKIADLEMSSAKAGSL